MGEVWAARHVERGWSVALKRVPDQGRAGWADPLSEVRAVAALAHPHVVRILDFGRDGTDVFLVMERAVGSLADALPGTWDDARLALDAVLAALAHAHARGILHLDVKPENVLRQAAADGQRWVLADFGLAHLQATRRDGDARVRGTPWFMAPEQFEASPEQWGPATDLYAVGCLAAVLVSGVPPFSASSLPELVLSHRRVEPTLAPPRFPVPAGFEDWWATLLAKDPAHRPALAADARAALDRLGHSAFQFAPSAPAERSSTFSWDGDDGAASLGVPGSEGPDEPLRRLVPDASLIDVRVLPLVGRKAALGSLRAALATVTGGPSGWVAVEGPDGIGRRHLARSFAWAAEEAGAAQRPPGRPGRTIVYLAFADDPAGCRLAEDALSGPGALVLAVGCSFPGTPLARVILGPLARIEAASLVRWLAPLDESLVALVANTVDGHPGRLIGRIRAWSAAEQLVPGPAGLVLDPTANGGLEPEVDGADPLLSLTWRVEEDADLALDGLRAALDDPTLQGRPGRALWLVGLAERALTRATRPDPAFAVAVALLHTRTLLAAGQTGPVLAVTERLVARARAAGDTDTLAAALLQRAQVVRFHGQDPTPLLAEAEALAPSPAVAARARATRGSELIRQGSHDEAAELLRSAEVLLVTHGVRTFLGTTRYWLGNALFYQGDVDGALVAQRAAVDAFRDVGNATGEANALVQVVSAAIELGRLGVARGALEEATRAASVAESPWLDAEVAGVRGCLHEAEGQLEAAAEALQDALGLAADVDVSPARLHLWLARVQARRGRRTEAAHHLSIARALALDSLPGLEVSAIHLATLSSTDPQWAEALLQCRATRLSRPVRWLLRDLSDSSDRVVAEAARSVLVTADG